MAESEAIACRPFRPQFPPISGLALQRLFQATGHPQLTAVVVQEATFLSYVRLSNSSGNTAVDLLDTYVPCVSRALLSSPLQIIKSTPATTREFVAGVVVLSVVNGYLRYHSEPPNSFIPYLTVVPGQSFLFPWTFFTAGFVEQNFLEVS